jgi:hypothetical protein
MSPQGNSIGFLYIDQNGILLFTSTTPAVIQFPFPPDIVRDLEIIDKDLLKNEMENVIKNNTLQPTRYIFALSENVLFEKPFQDSKSTQTEKDIQEFLDNMPFERTATIIFENAISKIIATNKDLYQTVARILAEHGSVVEYIFPSYIIGIDVNQALAMTQPILMDIHRRAPSLRQYSFLTDPGVNAQPVATQQDKGVEKADSNHLRSKQNKRILLLVGVFVLLLGILAAVYFMSQGK